MKLIPLPRPSTSSGTKFSSFVVRHKQDENEAPLEERTFGSSRKHPISGHTKKIRSYQLMERRQKVNKKPISRCCAPSQRMSVNELKALSRQIDLSNTTHDSSANTSPGASRLLKTCEIRPSRDEIASLSHQLRTNLSLAKLKLMASLSHSQAPKDIQVYECLTKNSTPAATVAAAAAAAIAASAVSHPKTTYDTKRTLSVRKTAVNSGENLFKRRASPLRLDFCTNANPCVTVNSKTKSSKTSSLPSSIHYPAWYSPSSEESDEPESPESPIHSLFGSESPCQLPSNLADPCSPLMMPACDSFDPPPMSPTGINKFQVFLEPWGNDDNDDCVILNDAQHELMETASLIAETGPLLGISAFSRGLEVTEDEINSWLQRGGGDHGSLAMVTDQELADLLNFDVSQQS